MAEINSIPVPPRVIDLTGQTFGKWEVLEYRGRSKRCTMWLCRCECGVEKAVIGNSLRQGKSRSCPSCAHSLHDQPGAHGTRFIDLTGQTFGKWTVIRYAGHNRHKHTIWLCRCECGTEKPVVGSTLRNGSSKSCFSCACETHCMTDTLEYNTWRSMLNRCRQPTTNDYALYGGRGISVCERWKSFENFFADMGTRPSSEHSIERLDSNGNYEPSNCCWATPTEQGRNKRNNRMLSFGGKIQCLSAWAEECGINPVTLSDRLERGWFLADALTKPVRAIKRKS